MKDLASRSLLKLLGFTVSFLSLNDIVMSPDIVAIMVKKAGFKIVKNSLDFKEDYREANLYFSRDILLLLALDL